MLSQRRFVLLWTRLYWKGTRVQRYQQAHVIYDLFSPLRFLLFCLRKPRLAAVAIRARLSTPAQLERMIERDRSRLHA